MNKIDHNKQIVNVSENGEFTEFLNFKGEVLLQVKTEFVPNLKDYFTWPYRVKCESSADMIRSLAKGLLETANNIEKEV